MVNVINDSQMPVSNVYSITEIETVKFNKIKTIQNEFR